MANSTTTSSTGDIKEVHADKREKLGTLRVTSDGRKFRYAKAGGALAAGKMCVGAIAEANHINVSVAAAAIGDTVVSVTVGATAVTENAYEDGFLQVNDGTGEGHAYLIASNTACDASGVTLVTLAEPIRVALVASATSEVSLIPNPWNGVTHSATEESMASGVAMVPVASGAYCWVQTGGVGCCLMSGAPGVGAPLTLGATAGALLAISATIATTVTQPIVGTTLATAGVSTEYKPVMLQID